MAPASLARAISGGGRFFSTCVHPGGAIGMTASVKESAAGVWKAFASRDPETIRAVLTGDATWIAPERNATQVALGLAVDMLESRDGIIAFLVDHFRKLFPQGAQFEFTKVIAEGDTVVFEQRMTGS